MQESNVLIEDGNCFACGEENSFGLQLHCERDVEKDSTAVIARITLQPHFQGWKGFSHGGIVATLLDEAMAYAVGFSGHRGTTASMTTRFRKPVPLQQALIVRARVTGERRHVIFTTATIENMNGVILAEGEAKFVSQGFIDAVTDDFTAKLGRDAPLEKGG